MSHLLRCSNTRKLLSGRPNGREYTLGDLFGSTDSGGVALHTILSDGLDNLDSDSQKTAANLMITALSTDATRGMLYRDFFTLPKANWPGSTLEASDIESAFGHADVLEHFVTPHVHHPPEAAGSDVMANLIDRIIADDGVTGTLQCKPLGELKIKSLETHVEYNIKQFYLMRAARKHLLLTDRIPRASAKSQSPLADEKCAQFNEQTLTWACVQASNKKCVISNGVPTLISDICDGS